MKAFVALSMLLAAVSAGTIDYRNFKSKNIKMDVADAFKTGNFKPSRRITPASVKKPNYSTRNDAECGIANPDGIADSVSCGSDPKILGGQTAEPHQFPWLVHMTCNAGWLCTASIIHPNWILTAGHCVDNCPSYELRVGAHSRFDGGQIYNANTSILHEGYSRLTLHNDIGLIYVDQAIEYSEKVRPICLPNRANEDNYLEGATTLIAGWGLISDNAIAEPTCLRYLDGMTVISVEDCEAVYQGTGWEGCICILPPADQGTCSGDSGGALNYFNEPDGRYYQVGVTSYVSSAGCDSGLPDGFTRVTYYMDWIETNTNGDVVIDP